MSFCLLTCKGKKENIAAGPPPPTVVDVMIAGFSNVSSEIEANGNVIAGEFVELHPEVSGRLTYLNVPEGNSVKQGTIMARINDAELQAQLAKAKSQLELQQKTQERLNKLLTINGINQADYDIVVNAVNSLQADINYTKALIEKTIVKAPFGGIVGLRQVSPGAYVSPATIIATVQQIDKIKIDFTIPEGYGTLLKKNDVVEVSIAETDKKRRKAVILAVEPLANTTSRNIKLRAILKEGSASPGAFVKVYIKSGSQKNRIFVPSNAIIPEDRSKILVVVKNGKSTFVKIETGARETGTVEVTSGIQPGDSVVVSGVLFTKPDSPVKVRSIKNLASYVK